EGYEYGSFHFLEPSFLHNYTDSTAVKSENGVRSYSTMSIISVVMLTAFAVIYSLTYNNMQIDNQNKLHSVPKQNIVE
ncbi:hypothetical protein ABNB87_19815, partial [Paenibacillus larvae]